MEKGISFPNRPHYEDFHPWVECSTNGNTPHGHRWDTPPKRNNSKNDDDDDDDDSDDDDDDDDAPLPLFFIRF